MKAIGTRSDGSRIEFDVVNGKLYCYNNQLTSLVVPQGVTWLDCDDIEITGNKNATINIYIK